MVKIGDPTMFRYVCPSCRVEDTSCGCGKQAIAVLRKTIAQMSMPLDDASLKQATTIMNAISVFESMVACHGSDPVPAAAPDPA